MKLFLIIFALINNSPPFGSAKGESCVYSQFLKAPSEALPQGVFNFMETNNEEIWKDIPGFGKIGFHFGHVSDVCLGRAYTHRGFVWSYTELPSTHFDRRFIVRRKSKLDV